MFRKLLRKFIRRELGESYRLGLRHGYDYRKMIDQAESKAKGAILGSQADRELEEILRSKGVKRAS